MNDAVNQLTVDCGLAEGGGGVRSTSGRGRVDDGNSKDGRWTAAASASTADGEDDEEE